jgi:Helix-turn-helix domain
MHERSKRAQLKQLEDMALPRAVDSASPARSETIASAGTSTPPVPELGPPGRGGARRALGPRRTWKPPTDAPRRLLTLAETAAYLGLSPWSVRELQWKGRLPRVALSHKLLFDRSDVDRLIEAAKERT